MFGVGEKKQENDTSEEEKVVKEQGNLDFFGRDVARKLISVVGDVDQKIRSHTSKVTGGLDANKGFFDGVLEKFKDRVRAIYPGKYNRGSVPKALVEFSSAIHRWKKETYIRV